MKRKLLILFFLLPTFAIAGTNEIWIYAKLIAKNKTNIIILHNSKRIELPADRLDNPNAVSGDKVKVLLLNPDEIKKLF